MAPSLCLYYIISVRSLTWSYLRSFLRETFRYNNVVICILIVRSTLNVWNTCLLGSVRIFCSFDADVRLVNMSRKFSTFALRTQVHSDYYILRSFGTATIENICGKEMRCIDGANSFENYSNIKHFEIMLSCPKTFFYRQNVTT